jgi:hypothetical protein
MAAREDRAANGEARRYSNNEEMLEELSDTDGNDEEAGDAVENSWRRSLPTKFLGAKKSTHS